MKRTFLLPVFVFAFFLPFLGSAHAKELILKTHYYKLWEVDSKEFEAVSHYQKTTFNNYDIVPLKEQMVWLTPYLKTQELTGLDPIKIQQYLQGKIAPQINREREDITLRRNEAGQIEFEGRGFESRQLDIKKAAELIAYALEKDLTYVHLPIITQPPIVTVLDEELKKKGIKELIGAGETYAAGSPASRFHNIDTGMIKFNGHLIAPGEELSFVKVLGPVDASTGYVPELVIKGAQTLPEYGGGLCQVSSTMFRAVLGAGLPVTDRRNHSYLVRYYEPHGLDATVYLPNPDFKFINDTGHSILVQTLRVEGDIHYNLYGTSDKRKVHVMGPHQKGWTGIPAPKTEYTDTLAPGVVKVVGHAVPGLHVTWFREVEYKDPAKKPFLETYDSRYQARPYYRLIGGAPPAPEESLVEVQQGQ